MFNDKQNDCEAPVVAAVGAAVVSGGGLAAITAGTFAWSAAIMGGVSSLVLSGLSAAIAPDPPKPDLGSYASIKSSGITRQIRQPILERRLVYGEARVSGGLAFIGSTQKNKYLHMVIMLASHEVEEIGEILINDVSITDDMLDGDNIINEGQYDGYIRIKKHLGTDAQSADSDLVSEVSEWTTNHKLSGIAYVYLRLKWDRDIFPSGIPNFSAWVKGKKCYDSRDSTTKWTPNIALQTNDYLTDSEYSIGTPINDVDTTTLEESANTCEEIVSTTNLGDTITGADSATNIISLSGVNDRLQYQTGDKVQLSGATIPGGLSASTDYYVIVYQRKDNPRIKLASSLENAFAGTAVAISGDGSCTITKQGEPRYCGGGVIKLNSEPGKNIKEILSGMGGVAVYSGGKWRLLAAKYRTPTLSYSLDDLVSPIKIQTSISRRDRFNIVQGVYTSQINDGNPSDYPAVSNSTYLSNDNNEVLKKPLDLPFAQRAHTCMRIAKIDMERSRQEIIFTASFSLTAFKLQVGDNFYFSEDRYGWLNKVFEVIEWALSIDNEGAPIINIKARENASAVYDWNNGEETTVDPAPNTNLPDPFTVEVAVGFSLDSVPSFTQDGDRIFSVVASWDAPENQFVLSGGKSEVEFKETTETNYKSAGIVDGNVTQMRIAALQIDVLYDLRIFHYNSLGVRSAETVINNFLVGSSVTTSTEDWENETLSRSGDDWESDTLTSEDWEA